MTLSTRARLLISCPDRPGIVAAVSQCLFEQGANIVHSDQHTTDPEGGVFFMRIEFDLPELDSRGAELQSALLGRATSIVLPEGGCTLRRSTLGHAGSSAEEAEQ